MRTSFKEPEKNSSFPIVVIPFHPIRREDIFEEGIEYVKLVFAMIEPSTYAVRVLYEVEPEYVTDTWCHVESQTGSGPGKRGVNVILP